MTDVAAEPCCSDLELDQLLLDELDDDHAARLRAHVAASPRCHARLMALQTVKQAWAERAPPFAPATSTSGSASMPTSTSNSVISLVDARQKRRWLFTRAATILAAAATVVIAVRQSGPEVRTKGPRLSVTLTTEQGGRMVDVFSGDGVVAGARVVAHVVVDQGAHVAVIAGGRVVARGAPGSREVDVVFVVDTTADYVVVACRDALEDIADAEAVADCSRDTFALRVEP
jgi:hypothetical protein